MLVVSKKQILKILAYIGCFILLLQICMSAKGEDTISTMGTLSGKKLVVLDPGHGEPDNGAVGITGTAEAGINLSIGLKVKELLENSGVDVILTRETDSGIHDSNCNTIKEKKRSDLNNRVRIGNESGADIFVSIHLNKIDEQKYWGWQTFFKKANKESEMLATCIQNNITKVVRKGEQKGSTENRKHLYCGPCKNPYNYCGMRIFIKSGGG